MDLVYISGQAYAQQAKVLCDKFKPHWPGVFAARNCYSQIDITQQEMEKAGSDLYSFLKQYPNGLGKPD